MIYNIKLFIRQILSEEDARFHDKDNPIDFDILNLRNSLDQVYSDGNQFEFNEKGDACEAYEAIISQIYENLDDFDEEIAEKFSKLVDVHSKINTSYIYADELLSPIPFSKQSAIEDINELEKSKTFPYGLITYVKSYLDLQKSKDNLNKIEREEVKGEESDSDEGTPMH